MDKEPRKMILVRCCDDCPHNGTCQAWKGLTRQQRVSITLNPKYQDFVLNGCPLEDYEGA